MIRLDYQITWNESDENSLQSMHQQHISLLVIRSLTERVIQFLSFKVLLIEKKITYKYANIVKK